MNPLRAIALAVAALAGISLAGAQTLSEGEHKVAIVYNIMMFVQWPAADADKPLRLCVVDGDGDALGTGLFALDGHRIANRPIQVRNGSAGRLTACDAAYLSAQSAGALKQLGNTPVLTIGNSYGFIDQGVMVNLVQEGRRIGFDIGMGAMRRSRLSASAKLLRLARYVKED